MDSTISFSRVSARGAKGDAFSGDGEGSGVGIGIGIGIGIGAGNGQSSSNACSMLGAVL